MKTALGDYSQTIGKTVSGVYATPFRNRVYLAFDDGTSIGLWWNHTAHEIQLAPPITDEDVEEMTFGDRRRLVEATIATTEEIADIVRRLEERQTAEQAEAKRSIERTERATLTRLIRKYGVPGAAEG